MSTVASERGVHNGPGPRTRIPLAVVSPDRITRAGLKAQLRARPELWVLEEEESEEAVVALVAVDEVDEDALRLVRAHRREGHRRVVLVVGRLDDAGLLASVEAGACGLLRRAEASPERIAAAVEGAHGGDGTLPPDLLGRLLAQVGQLGRQVLTPRALTLNGLTRREIEVLRLVAEGYDTSEVADRLSYSERTIKNLIHDVTTRLNLRNRAHAVAYAVRQGLV